MGRLDNSFECRFALVKGIPLLILDDFGLQALTEQQQDDLFALIAWRHERMSTIITSNRDFKEWPMIFTNQLVGSAATDRLIHRALRITITGQSYRLKTFLEASQRNTIKDDLTEILDES